MARQVEIRQIPQGKARLLHKKSEGFFIKAYFPQERFTNREVVIRFSQPSEELQKEFSRGKSNSKELLSYFETAWQEAELKDPRLLRG